MDHTPTTTDARGGIEIIRDKKLAAIPWLVHGFSTRTAGFSSQYGGNSLNLGFTPDDERETVERNRALFLGALSPGHAGDSSGLNAQHKSQHNSQHNSKTSLGALITLKQVHSDRIHIISEAASPPPAGDGMVTQVPGVLLAIQTADCLPILLVDTRQKVVATVHAGWRGTLARIAQKAVGAMQGHCGSKPEDILAAVGPGIHQCCYAVGLEVQQEFNSQFADAAELFTEVFESDPVRAKYPLLFLTSRPPGHSDLGPATHLNLVEANRRQLMEIGIAEAAISISALCTACHTEKFFSHRAEDGHTGRMMAVIGIRQGQRSA